MDIIISGKSKDDFKSDKNGIYFDSIGDWLN